MHAVYRELKEETGLTGSWIIQEVGSTRFTSRRGRRYLCITFVVEAEECELRERGMDDHEQNLPDSSILSDQKHSNGTAVRVVLNDAEHQDYRWVTRQQLYNQRIEGDCGLRCSPNMHAVMLDAFNVKKTIMAERRRINSEGDNTVVSTQNVGPVEEEFSTIIEPELHA